MNRVARRTSLVALAVAGLSLIGMPAASAHPLGNFTVNRYSGIVVSTDSATIDHVVDFAEIPTVQERSKTKVGLPAYARTACATAASVLTLSVGGSRVSLAVDQAEARFLPGAAGLQTLRLECTLRGRLSLSGSTAVSFADPQATERVGWREITLQGDRATVSASSVPTTSVSKRLSSYPQDMLSSPLDLRSASADVRPGGERLSAEGRTNVLARPSDRLTSAFTNLVGEGPAGPGVVLLAVILAFVIGAAHAVAPGHGKTVMAFYLAGDKARSWRSALTVGSTVTITHTAGVLALGLLVTAGTALAPTSVYPILSVVSGVVILVLGLGLARRVLTGRSLESGHDHGPGGHTHGPASPGQPHPHAHEHPHHPDAHRHDSEPDSALAPQLAMAAMAGVAVKACETLTAPVHLHLPHPGHHDHDQAHEHGHPHDYDHNHDHDHDHDHDHSHDHAHDSHDHRPADLTPSHVHEPVRAARGSLVAIGLAGGLVPSPSALVVLLGASATGHAWLGVTLVLVFGLGMAVTLTGVGVLVSRAGGRLQASSMQRHPVAGALLRWSPALAAAGVVVLGVSAVVRGVSQIG